MWKEENIKHTSVKGKHLADLDVEGRIILNIHVSREIT